jgi:hypothetical protein
MMKTAYTSTSDFHNADLWPIVQPATQFAFANAFSYNFETFFHPFVGDLIAKLNRTSIAATLDPGFLGALKRDYSAFYSMVQKSTASGDTVSVNMDPGTIDTSIGGPYAIYNWELFYHIPVMIAVHMSQNQRFAEAQSWFHLVFDPTFIDAGTSPSYPFWKFIGFRKPDLVENLVEILSYTGTDPTQLKLKQQVLAGYNEILTTPFNPHAVARTRPLAYMYYVVMKYLDNLIAWGDNLFTQNTLETINEATLCYVLAANLLGPKPEQLPVQGTSAAQNYKTLAAAGMDELGNTLVELEVQFPFNTGLPVSQNGSGNGQTGPLFGTAQTLYFCFPPNQKLLSYWSTVDDRLFKIRHCENIQGVFEQLPLFDPPIDPGMLVQAAAAGINIGSIISGLNQPLTPYRSQVLIQKALEVANEVRSFGASLLSALEKGDAEHLAMLRQTDEVNLQTAVQNVRFLQYKQAQEATQSLLRTRANVLERYTYYLNLLNQTPNSTTTPTTFDTSNVPELTESTFQSVFQDLVGQFDQQISAQQYPSLQLAGTSDPSNQSGASGIGQLFLNTNEDSELNHSLTTARDLREASSVAIQVATVLTMIPELNIDLAFWGLGPLTKLFGGSKLSDATKTAAEVMQIIAAHEQDQGQISGKTGSYQRRTSETAYQANAAARELMQIGRQIVGSLIAEQVAYHEYTNAQMQVQQAQDLQNFMQTKFTNEELYTWMQGQLTSLFYQYYRFAFDRARLAEQTMKQELMRPELDQTTFVQFNYWDSGHQGLLSGEALHLDLKRMEAAYYDNNVRELEITRHVSLRQLNPLALIALRTTGQCTFTIPEWFFDRDCPGHYMRRIKSVGLSLPSVVGPYSTVNCTLTLQSSSVRVSSQLDSGNHYGRQPGTDSRFVDYFGSTNSIVTSSGTNDSGLFETNLKDERFLPFEGAGAVNSTWQLELPTAFPAFDYTTITDAILHVRYTARQAGDPLATQCVKELQTAFKNGADNLQLLFMLRNDFPTEWAAFVNSTSGTPAFTFNLQLSYFPYAVQGLTVKPTGIALYGDGLTPASPQPSLSVLPAKLNTGSSSATVSIAADSAALTQKANQVYMVISYSAG